MEKSRTKAAWPGLASQSTHSLMSCHRSAVDHQGVVLPLRHVREEQRAHAEFPRREGVHVAAVPGVGVVNGGERVGGDPGVPEGADPLDGLPPGPGPAHEEVVGLRTMGDERHDRDVEAGRPQPRRPAARGEQPVWCRGTRGETAPPSSPAPRSRRRRPAGAARRPGSRRGPRPRAATSSARSTTAPGAASTPVRST